ncbi:MAG: carbohydrate-binding domain-containing protein [Clostridia bacterium]|nr:carbohydrate-binding domain-containing protein [Clostridia bacterium]
MKRIISLLAVIALLCCAMPLSSSATELPVLQKVTDIKILIDRPVAGREATFDAAVNTKGIRLFVEQTEYSWCHHGIGWYDLTDERNLEEGDRFILGHEYSVAVYLNVDNPFYFQLAQKVFATVNGRAALASRENSRRCLVKYAFPACEEAPADITQLTIGGILYPVAGEHPVFEPAIDEERTERDLNAGTAFINGVAWYNSNTYQILGEEDVFEAGETYTVAVMLKAKGDYRFATDGDNSAVAATINGFTMTNITYQTNDDPSRYVKLSYEFTCEESDTIGGGAPVADIRIDYPVDGKTMSFQPTVYGQNCDVRMITVEDQNIYNGVKWTNRTLGNSYPKGVQFCADTDYSVTVLITTEDITDDDKWLSYVRHEDGTVTPYVKAYINGMPARVEPYKDISPAQMIQVTYDFPACHDTARTIDEIIFSDVTLPVVGETPDMYGTLEVGYTENTANTKKSVFLTWLEVGTNRVLGESDPFLPDCQYVVGVSLQTDGLSTFLMNESDKSYDGVVSFDGADEIETVWYSSIMKGTHLAVAAFFTPFAARPTPFDRVDVIGAVAPTVGQRPCYSATLTESLMPYAKIIDVTWYENGIQMTSDSLFKAGKNYYAQYTVVTSQPYSFEKVLDVSVNGDSTPVTIETEEGVRALYSNGRAIVEVYYGTLSNAAASGVTDYAEISGLMRPAPGQIPDFNVSIDSAYTEFGGVTWCELDDNGYVTKTLGYNDTFKKYTRYRAEIRVLPTAGRDINIDSRGATLNNEAARYYYLPGNAVTVYAEYDTSYCITDFNVRDVQYPIPGKTPDNYVLIRTDGAYDIGSIDWYYETNPGTASAGFSKLDGKFKADRRHQAYVELGTENGYWFATDKNGNLTVNITFDHKPMTFAYSTDSYFGDGACNKLEAACTFERAQDVDGVFVDGMWLTDGLYMDNSQWGVQTEQTVNKTTGYAYYENGVLTLHDFMWTAQGDYNMIDSYNPLIIKSEGQSYLETNKIGIASNDTLTLTGDGVLEIHSNERGVFAMDDVTVDSGTWILEDTKYEGMWLYSSLTVNGGMLDVYGKDGGLYGDDYPPVTINGGTVIARADSDYAIGWCDMHIANGATVSVGPSFDGAGAVKWDGQTDFIDYSYVEIAFESTVLLGDVTGDGAVNMLDVLALYNGASGKATLTDTQRDAADMNGDGSINMMDVLALYNTVSGKVK